MKTKSTVILVSLAAVALILVAAGCGDKSPKPTATLPESHIMQPSQAQAMRGGMHPPTTPDAAPTTHS